MHGREAMAYGREGGAVGATGNDGRRRASSAIAGSVLFRLSDHKSFFSTLKFIFVIRYRASRESRLPMCQK